LAILQSLPNRDYVNIVQIFIILTLITKLHSINVPKIISVKILKQLAEMMIRFEWDSLLCVF